MTPAITPRDYQATGIERTFELFAAGEVGVLVRVPTGCGKTLMGSLIAQKWLERSEDHRVLVMCHERQLVQQFADEIRAYLGLVPGVEMAEQRVTVGAMPRIVVASRQTLTPKRLAKFNPALHWLILVDEAHRYTASMKSFRHVVEWFGQNSESRRLGLTATPSRSDGVSLAKLFPGIASDYRLYDLDDGPSAVNDGWAVPFDQRFIEVEGVDFTNLREVAGDFDADELEQVMSERGRLLSMVVPTLGLIGRRQTLVFSPTVKVAQLVAQTVNEFVRCSCACGKVAWCFREVALPACECGGALQVERDGKHAESLDGEVPDAKRRDCYSRHQSGQFQILSVCGLCKEGYNDRSIAAVAIFRPTKSKALAEQMKGRGARPLPGVVDGLDSADERCEAIASSAKPDCLVIDLVGATGLGGCATTAHLYAEGKPDEVIDMANAAILRKAKAGEPIDVGLELKQAEIEWERQQKLLADVKYRQQQVEAGKVRKKRQAVMLFGRYKGTPVAELPTEYMRNLLEKSPPKEPWLYNALVRELKKRDREAGGKPLSFDGAGMRLSEQANELRRQAYATISACEQDGVNLKVRGNTLTYRPPISPEVKALVDQHGEAVKLLYRGGGTVEFFALRLVQHARELGIEFRLNAVGFEYDGPPVSVRELERYLGDYRCSVEEILRAEGQSLDLAGVRSFLARGTA